ncbi:hypothetical protein [Bacillus niameyensis]|uniref:hypothetical protein n=1 Tax=Bacillus niameyensis TaxID=1522308 RepID=UPI000780636F|nr:hypothetical protein [Bacillus niameyensis]
MNNEIKREMEKIEIPDELHARAETGIKLVKHEGRKSKRYPKWIVGVAASAMLMGATYSIGGSYIADAAESLLGKVIGSEDTIKEIKEVFPKEEVEAYLPQREQHLKLAKEHLSPEEYEEYSQLIKESMELDLERGKIPHADYEERSQKLGEEIESYGIYALMIHTFEEAQEMASYPIKRPTFVPEGYVSIREEAHTEQANVGKDPRVLLEYQQKDGEFNFITVTEKIDKSIGLGIYNNLDTYQLKGYTFEHAYGYKDGLGNVQTMRVTIPEKDYQITIDAALLSKEEMEKVLLSMVE